MTLIYILVLLTNSAPMSIAGAYISSARCEQAKIFVMYKLEMRDRHLECQPVELQ